MLRFLRKSRELVVEFCDRSARVCDAGCRVAALREGAVMQALRLRVGV